MHLLILHGTPKTFPWYIDIVYSIHLSPKHYLAKKCGLRDFESVLRQNSLVHNAEHNYVICFTKYTLNQHSKKIGIQRKWEMHIKWISTKVRNFERQEQCTMYNRTEKKSKNNIRSPRPQKSVDLDQPQLIANKRRWIKLWAFPGCLVNSSDENSIFFNFEAYVSVCWICSIRWRHWAEITKPLNLETLVSCQYSTDL